MFGWLRRKDNRNLQKFYASLPALRAGRGSYSKQDRYRDFRQVFMGDSSSEQGQRVLAQILDASNGSPDFENEVHDHARMAFKAGKRALGLEIIKWLNVEPAQRETDNEPR